MRFRAQVGVGLLLLASWLVLAGCGGHNRSLSALESDPMATATFAHTTLVREDKQGSGTTPGKPVHAMITRRFAYQGITEKALVELAATEAQKNGWQTEFSRPTSFTGTKTIDPVKASITVTTSDLAGAPAFFIYLTAQ